MMLVTAPSRVQRYASRPDFRNNFPHGLPEAVEVKDDAINPG